jgi:putative endonuclease
MWFVYILKCYDGSLYVGCTTDVSRRVDEHNSNAQADLIKKSREISLN